MSVRCGGSTFNGRHHNAVLFRIDVEKNTPVADAAAESLPASLEFAHIALEGILFHRIDRKADASLVVGWGAFKRSLRGPGEDDQPRLFLFGGVHQGSRSHRVRTRLGHAE